VAITILFTPNSAHAVVETFLATLCRRVTISLWLAETLIVFTFSQHLNSLASIIRFGNAES
jgi:hypothetical protein